MVLIIEIAGWIAAGAMLVGYALLSGGRVDGRDRSYQAVNIVGSLLVGVNSLLHDALPSASVNFVWLAIGLLTVARSTRGAAGTAGARAARRSRPWPTDPTSIDDLEIVGIGRILLSR